MKSKLWVFRECDPFRRAALAQALSISSATASLLLARGVTSPHEARSWMSHQVPHDPFLIPDMEPAVERLHRAVSAQEPICFYGDYDVDGMSATALYLSFFASLGANVRAYVPHRKREGYGLNAAAVQRLLQAEWWGQEEHVQGDLVAVYGDEVDPGDDLVGGQRGQPVGAAHGRTSMFK